MRTTQIAVLAGAAALTLFATPAFAQDDHAPEAEPFTGVYVGGSFGYAVQPNDVGEFIEFDRNLDGVFGDTVTTAAGANAFSPGFCNGRARTAAPSSCRNDQDGIEYYGRVGFDKQFGNFMGRSLLVGVVGEFGKADINDSVSAYSTTPASYTISRDLKWEATVRARAGLVVDTTLFYGTAGVGYANIANSFSTTNTANAFSDNGNDKQWGFTGGGGIEQKIGRNFSIGLEYMFHRYQDTDYRVRASAGTAPATNPFLLAGAGGTDFRRGYDYFRWHSIRATAAFRF